MKQLLRLKPFFRGHGLKLSIGFVLMALQNWGFTAMPAHLKVILDELTSENRSAVIATETFWVLAIMTVAGLSMFGMRNLIITVSREMEYDLRKTLFAKLSRLDFAFFQRHQTGDLISRCTNDLDHVRVLMGPGIMYIPNSLMRLFLFTPVLFAIDTTLTALVFVQMSLLIALIVVLIPRMKPLHAQLQDQVGRINSRVWQLLTGMNTLKLFTREKVELERFDQLNQDYIKKFMGVEKYQASMWPLFQTFFALSEVILLSWGGLQVIRGQLTLGELLQFKVMVAVLSFPVMSLGWVMAILQQGLSALERIALIMDEPTPTPPNGSWKTPSAGSENGLQLELKNLSYHYPGQTTAVLKNINLSLKPGEVLGITGPVGCGKSTMMHLLTGILHPQAGQFFINGVDVCDLDPDHHHRAIAFCPQDAFLFSRPLKENIALSAALSTEKVRHHAREAALEKDVDRFERGFDEWVGERGVTLSGGQRQRTALARALYKNAALIILDDALSAVDANTEAEILSQIRKRGQTQSMIIVSHRISAIQHCDRILVLNKGQCAEEGSHQDLMDHDGLYRQLAELQRMDRELEACL